MDSTKCKTFLLSHFATHLLQVLVTMILILTFYNTTSYCDFYDQRCDCDEIRPRGGRRKQRSIPTVITCRPPRPVPVTRPPPTLTPVPIQPVNTNNRKINLHYFNARSCLNKTDLIHDYVLSNDVDILFITETWLQPSGDEPAVAAMTPPSYKFISKPRQERRGGGVAVMYRASFEQHIAVSTLTTESTFESTRVQLTHNGRVLNFVCLYRPPSSASNPISLVNVRDEINSMFSDISTKPGEPVIVGDFNFNYPSDGRPSELHEALITNNLNQIVTKPTHQSGNIIDWVVVGNSSTTVFDIEVSDIPFSDHHPIKIGIEITKPSTQPVSVTSRNIRSIDVNDFRNDLNEALADLDQSSSIDDFDARVSAVVEAHAPMMTRTIPNRRYSPWYCQEVKAAKTKCRQMERTWLKTRKLADEEKFKMARMEWRKLLRQTKTEYYISKIEHSNSCKQMFATCNELLGKSKSSSLPTSIPDLPNKFVDFFEEKIDNIRNKMKDHKSNTLETTFEGTPFVAFTPVTEEFVHTLISKAPKKSCELDPIPHSLLPICIDILIPHITSIINKSLTSGIVPVCMKQALVRPLLKKPSLDKNEFKNYRPVSNLSFISKILEKVVLTQIMEHLQGHEMLHRFQSAYRAHHSTETALLKVVNDLIVEADSNRCSILCLLDLSAAFDTIDHDILMTRLEATFGFKDTVLDWFSSYLRDRCQCVVVDGVRSNDKVLKYGVPQGSVLGPVLFTLYMQPLGDVIARHGVNHHCYADDTQLYASVHPNDIVSLTSSLEACLIDVKEWTDKNKLMLNDNKTEALLTGRPNVVKSIDVKGIHFGDSDIVFSPFVKNLGVLIDSHLTFGHQVSNVSKQLNVELRRIRQIRNNISTTTASTLARSLVLSKLDYCNSLLTNVSKDKIKSLQVVQNNAARLVFNKPRFHKVSPLLMELHWLPVGKRITYKLCSIVYMSLNTHEPSYISDMLHLYTPARNLRSKNDKTVLSKPMMKRKIGEQSFVFSAPHFWNSLPEGLRCSDSLSTFKKGLKTHLFVT